MGIKLDVSNALKDEAKKKLDDAKEKAKEKAKDKVKDKLKGLFG